MTVKMRAPGSYKGHPIFFSGGSSNNVASTLLIDVPEADVATLLRMGFVIEPIEWQYKVLANNANSTLDANAIAGARHCVLNVSGGANLSHTTDIAANMIAEIQNARIGDTWRIRIVNVNSGTVTLVGGTGVTITGTAAVATNRTVEFMATYSAANTIGLQNIGFGNAV